MTKSPIVLVYSLAVFSGCCLRRPIDIETFRQETLEQKIASFEHTVGKRFVCHPITSLLGAIASHGYPAADAMVERLLQPHSRFPPDDAIVVLELVHASGWDLRHHDALRVLEQIAATGQDDAVCEHARKAAQRIRKVNRVLMNDRHLPGARQADHAEGPQVPYDGTCTG